MDGFDNYEIIQYHNNLYKITGSWFDSNNNQLTLNPEDDIPEGAVWKYIKVDDFTKMDITNARSWDISITSITVGTSEVKDVRNWIANINVLEDFIITSNDTSKVTASGYNITGVSEGTTTITLTGTTSGKTKDITINVIFGEEIPGMTEQP